jgi:hypothetical protein
MHKSFGSVPQKFLKHNAFKVLILFNLRYHVVLIRGRGSYAARGPEVANHESDNLKWLDNLQVAQCDSM